MTTKMINQSKLSDEDRKRATRIGLVTFSVRHERTNALTELEFEVGVICQIELSGALSVTIYAQMTDDNPPTEHIDLGAARTIIDRQLNPTLSMMKVMARQLIGEAADKKTVIDAHRAAFDRACTSLESAYTRADGGTLD